MKTVVLEKDYSIKLSSSVVDFAYPDHVFIPMYSGYKLKVANKEAIKKEQVLLINEQNIGVFSPISGVVVGAKECMMPNGEMQKCLVIENDFKEKMLNRTTMRKNLKQLSEKDFYEILDSKSVPNMDNGTELLIDLFKNNIFDKILINGIDDEPYIATKTFLVKNYAQEILETLSFLGRIFKTKENMIVLKNNDRDNIEGITNVLGTYPEISLTVVPDLYPIGNVDILKKHLNADYSNTLILSPANIMACYNIIKKNKLVTEKYITITGEAITNPIVINAKIGSSIKKIIAENIKYLNNDEVDYIVNGSMRGVVLDIDELIVTNDLDGIIINFKKDYQESECINCGKCSQVCPVGIDPNLIFNKNKKIEDSKKCINCGLCSYICPVYINFKRRIEDLRNEK